MESEETSYSAKSYNPLIAFAVLLPVYLLLIGVSIGIGVAFHKPIIGGIGWVAVSSIPFLFQEKILAIFTRQICLVFNDKLINAEIYTLKNRRLVQNFNYLWSDINSYKFSLATANSAYLVINFINGSSKTFSFKENISREDILNKRSIVTIFTFWVRKYNSSGAASKIVLKSNFLTTKSGSRILWILGLSSIFAIIANIMLRPGTFPFALISLFLVLGLVVKRKQDTTDFQDIENI